MYFTYLQSVFAVPVKNMTCFNQ